MTPLTRISLAVLGLLGAAALAVGATTAVYALRSQPQMQGVTHLGGLGATVHIQRDAADVTHILAQTPLDAFKALGMVHAQERAWQLEFNRRVMHGTLSEVLGPATLPTDKLLRTLGIRQAAERQWQGLPAPAQAALQAYADGVNSFMAHSQQALTPEFLALGIDPRAAAREGQFWTPTDAMGWALMMALDLGGNWGNEFARLSSLQVLDTERLWQLFPAYPGEPPAATADLALLYRGLGVYADGSATPSAKNAAAKPTATSDGANFYSTLTRAASTTLARAVNDWAHTLGEVDGKGSNNWVVAGSHTHSGRPLLANDPHLGLSAPAVWYFARLQSPAAGGQGELDVTGATLPGLPFVVLGRNAHLAWGFTNTAPDVQDLYLEQINPVNPAQYRVPAPPGQPAAWADFDTREEIIRVKGQGEVRHTVRSTRHGPVLSDAQASHAELLDTRRFVLALRWSALDADNHTVLAGLEGNRARSVDDLLHAYRHYHSPMQNVVVADVQGHVAYKAAGKVPVRGPDNDIRGVAPSPGWERRYDWQGWIPYADTPEVRLGEPSSPTFHPDATPAAAAARHTASAQAQQRGWLATANQRIHGTDYPHFITQDWTYPYRQQRIETLLQATPRHTRESMQALQADELSLATLKLLPVLQNTPSDHPLAAAAQQALAHFDGVMRADHAAPLIFSAWADVFTRQALVRTLGETKTKALYGKRHFRTAVEDALARNDGFWCGEGGCAAASSQALATALTELQARHGPRVDQWRWGHAHPAVSKHQPFSNVKLLAPAFEVSVPTGGDSFTVNVGQFQLDNPAQPYANRHAASLRAVYDLADLENSVFIYQTGQSGNVLSPRYRDMSAAWAKVQYRPLQLQPSRWTASLQVLP
jgi:penicillin amidase